MVTKPTGRPRGRPKKPDQPKPKKVRGRPPQPLAANPDRYALAYFEAHFLGAALHRDRVSELQVAEQLAAQVYGETVQTPENLASKARGERYQVWMPPFRLDQRPYDGAPNWRHGNSFRPWADDLRRKLRRLRNGSNDDARWLRAMGIAWFVCLQGNVDEIEYARGLAGSAGEAAFFEEKMLPVAYHEAGRRASKVT
jgi:hypothetical protein